MADIAVVHTARLSAAELGEIRELLHAAFAGDFTDEDLEHGLGGMHALVRHEGRLVAHASVVMRRLLHEGRALRTGYVESVGVHPEHRRAGHGAEAMTAVEELIRGGYELGALGSSEEALPFYAARGWRRWHGPTFVLAPDGVRRTPDDDDAVHVLPGPAPLRLDGKLTCDWRDGDVW